MYDWTYDGILGRSFVVWELSNLGGKTRLKLMHVGHETFPRDNSVFARETCEAGWTYFLKDSLAAFLTPAKH